MLVHGHLPTKVMDTMIIPLIKNPNRDTSDKGNYRPIALVTPVSKIFELVLLSKMET